MAKAWPSCLDLFVSEVPCGGLGCSSASLPWGPHNPGSHTAEGPPTVPWVPTQLRVPPQLLVPHTGCRSPTQPLVPPQLRVPCHNPWFPTQTEGPPQPLVPHTAEGPLHSPWVLTQAEGPLTGQPYFPWASPIPQQAGARAAWLLCSVLSAFGIIPRERCTGLPAPQDDSEPETGGGGGPGRGYVLVPPGRSRGTSNQSSPSLGLTFRGLRPCR